MKEKTLNTSEQNGAKKVIKDIDVIGNTDHFKLLFKASSKEEGWMKSTKAMEIDTVGCLVQVTTQQRNPDGSYVVSEALAMVNGVEIVDDENGGRRLVNL